MRQRQVPSAAFLGLTALVVIGAAASIAASWPLARSAAKSQAASLVGEATSAPLAEAATDYKLATLLDTKNEAAYLGLARTQITAGMPDAALKALEQAGDGSEAAQLRVRTLIELGRANDAVASAKPLAQPGRSDAGIVLAALTYALAGQSSDIPALVPLVSSPEAAKQLERIKAGNLPLAIELLASGLAESSRTLLVKLTPSFERNLALARIANDRHTPDDLAAATEYLQQAIAINPSALSGHQLLMKVYEDRGMGDAAAKESILIKKLEAGRP